MRDGWKEIPLGDVVEHTIGGVWGAESDTDEVEVTVVRSTEFTKRGYLNFETGVSRSIKHSQLKSRELKEGDILLEKSGGGPDQPVGRVVYVTAEIPNKFVCSNFVQLVRPNSRIIEPLLLFHIMWHWHAINRTLEFQAQTTGIRNLRTPDYLEQEINLPPLPEQKRIVDLISSVDGYIEALQQQLESAQTSRNALLHELLTAGGDDWEYKILSDICEVRDGTHDSPKPSREGFALVTSKNIKDGRLDLESAYLISPKDYAEVNKRSKVEQFNLLISMIGTIGEVVVVEEEPDFAIKNVGLLKSTDPTLSRYLCHYLESQLGKNVISLSVSGSTQKFISLGKLRALPILYPPRENQKLIVEAMSLFDQQISRHLKVSAKIQNLRSSLLSDLLSGVHTIPPSYDKVMGVA